MSLKPCLNLRLQRWLKPSLCLVNILISNEPLILKVFLSLGLIDFHSVFQNMLHLLDLRMLGSTLSHSLTTCG